MITDGAKILIKNEVLNKYIFILRDDKPDIPEPNTWEIPGGGIEPGETPTEALKREIKEELDIRVYDIKKIHSKKIIRKFLGKKYHITGYYFVGKTNVTDLSSIVLTEGQQVNFFTIEEILKMPNVSPTFLNLINILGDRLNETGN